MDKELLGFVSEFRLDRYRQIYMRIFLDDTWILLRGSGPNVQFWSKEEHEWQSGDAGQAKYMFETPQEAWEHYRQYIYEPPAWHTDA
jgi:hypothetical protein